MPDGVWICLTVSVEKSCFYLSPFTFVFVTGAGVMEIGRDGYIYLYIYVYIYIFIFLCGAVAHKTVGID